MKRRAKLLHVTSDTGRYGGKDAVVFTLLRRLGRGGEFDVAVVCFRRELVYREFVREDIPVHVLRMYWTFDLSAVMRLASVAQENHADLIHTHDNKSHFLGRIAGRMLGLPVVSTFHGQTKFGLELNLFKRKLYHWLVRKTDGLVTHFIAVSSELRHELLRRGVDPRHVTRIPNGIDADEFAREAACGPSRDDAGIPNDAFVIGVVGRLSREKGHQHFFNAVAPVCREWPSVRCVIVGDGPLRKSLSAEVDRLGIRSQVMFMGFRRDIAGMYSLMDMVVLPSLGEGLPVTLLEAMALGKPTVASSVGGVPEVIQDGCQGLVVPPGEPGSLRAAMERILTDRELRGRLGQSAAARVRSEFGAERLVEQTCEVYRAVLETA